MRILVALSGGIDSSVVAHLLHRQGHELVGVRFSLWSDPLAPALAQVLPSKCCNAQTAARAARVASELSIPYHVVDFEEDFKREVVDPFLEEHRRGRTPNPCVGCNRSVKFGRLLALAKEFGCERLATGHYARTAVEQLSDGSRRTILLEAEDAGKDQSYYLYGLTQEQLESVLFPLGSMRKADVYGLADAFGVPFDRHYRESQDLCFFPEKTPHAFLKRHLGTSLRPGEIVRRDGTVVGHHDGIGLYTVGQRRGLGVGGLRVPLEIVAKDSVHNRLIVAERGTERVRSVALRDLRWVSWSPQDGEELEFECRLRSLSVRLQGRFQGRGREGVFAFRDPQPPQAAGQSLVLYRGPEVVGGGIMEENESLSFALP